MNIWPWRLSCLFLVVSAFCSGAQTPPQAEAPGEQPATLPPSRNPVVIIRTSRGDLRVELYPDRAPRSVANFLRYVDDKHYDGTIFHRVIAGFMIQGGRFTADFTQKPTREPILNEATNGLKNTRGTLAMARTSDINSATAQFFINVVDNAFLDHTTPTPQGFGYCVFGKVVEGMDVVDRIRSVPTGRRGYFENVPKEDIEIREIVRSGE